MNDVDKSIKNLKELRLLTGLTQEKLSQILDVRIKTVSDWERGVKQPRMSAQKMLLLCQALDCSLDELVLAIDQAQIKTSLTNQSEKIQKQLVAA
jgi:transcriptional regulator with XRE-family HTH domain